MTDVRAKLESWAHRFADANMAAEAAVCRTALAGDAVARWEAGALLLDLHADADLLMALFRPAAEAGAPAAMAELGQLLYRHSVDDGHGEAGMAWLQQAMAAGSARAFTHVARAHEEKGQLEEAERLYRRGVAGGDPLATLMFADMLNHMEDYARAEAHYRRAVEDGNLTAMSNLGTMLHGQGRWLEAARLYRIAVESGDGTTLALLIRLVVLDGADIAELCEKCQAARPLNNNLRAPADRDPADDPYVRLTREEVWPQPE
jgi:TPR repeat protein